MVVTIRARVLRLLGTRGLLSDDGDLSLGELDQQGDPLPLFQAAPIQGRVAQGPDVGAPLERLNRNWRQDADGNLRGHTIDPRTGLPSATGVASATVVARSCALADALTTAVLVLSAEDGLRLLEDWPDEDAVEGHLLLLSDDGEIEVRRTTGVPAVQLAAPN